jgi:hypothetical protein
MEKMRALLRLRMPLKREIIGLCPGKRVMPLKRETIGLCPSKGMPLMK